jgi:hypothetical protein
VTTPTIEPAIHLNHTSGRWRSGSSAMQTESRRPRPLSSVPEDFRGSDDPSPQTERCRPLTALTAPKWTQAWTRDREFDPLKVPQVV